jgi:hypothetical protein
MNILKIDQSYIYINYIILHKNFMEIYAALIQNNKILYKFDNFSKFGFFIKKI